MTTFPGKLSSCIKSCIKYTKDVNEARKSFSLHDYLSSKHFVEEVTETLWGWSIFAKAVLIPLSYFFTFSSNSFSGGNLAFFFFLYGPILYSTNSFVHPVDYTMNKKYKEKRYVYKGFNWKHFFHDLSTYANIYDFLIHIVSPLHFCATGGIGGCHLIIGSLLVTVNLCTLYGFYHCDFLTFIDHREYLVLHDWTEMNHIPKRLTIVESTSTCISIKNISEKDLVLERNSTITRCTENNCKYISQERLNFCKSTLIPPGGVFKVVTTEFKGDEKKDGEQVSTASWLRSFGPAKAETVRTFVKFSIDGKYYNVEMVHKYKFGEKRYLFQHQLPSEIPSICDSSPVSDSDSISSFQLL